MAIWMQRRELEEPISFLSDATVNGMSLVIYPREKQELLASDFVTAIHREAAREVSLEFEFPSVGDLYQLLDQLKKNLLYGI